MEPRPVTSHKENVPLRPAAALRPEQRRFLRTLGVSLGSGHGPWVPVCQAARGGPAATCSPRATLYQEPRQVQTNLVSPHPVPALQDMLGRLVNSNFLQQSNLQPRTPRTPEKVPAAQQCNLRLSMATSPLHQDSLGVLAPRLLQTPPAAEPHCPDPRPTAGVAPLCGRTWPGPRFWGGLGGRTSKLTGEPLTLEDLAIPALRQAWHPSHAPIHQPLASVQYLEHQAARLRGQVPREPPSPAQRDPCPGSGQGLPAHPQSSRPLLASWDERRRHPRGHRETTDLLVAQGPHADRSDSRAPSKPASPKTTLGLRTGHYHDSEQATLPAQPLRPGDEGAPGPTHGSGDRGHPAGSLGFSSAATAGSVLPGREGDVHIPRELGRRKASWSLDVDVFLARRAVLQNKAQDCVAPEGHPAARRQLLSRCFRSWRRMAHRVLSHRQLLREGFRALQWTLWLQEARLEVAWRRHSKALLAQTFREWRLLVQREKQGQHLVQAASGPCTSWGARDQVTCWGREAVGRPTPSSRAGSLREEKGARPPPSQPGRSLHGLQGGDSRDRSVQTLQVLQQLAGFLLHCQKEDLARKETRPLGEVTQRTQKTAVPPAACKSHRDWVHRCFWAWQRVAQRGAQCQGRLAEHCVRTLRRCLGRWVQMKQLRASDQAAVTQLSLCRQEAGALALWSSAHGVEMVARASLQGACHTLALHRALLLQGMRLSQHQRANSFQGTREQCFLSCWRLRMWGSDTPSASGAATWAAEPLGSIPGGSAWLGSMEKDAGAPELLDTLLASHLWAAGWQQQDQCHLPWQAQGAAGQCCSLQRRILLTWSHWTAAQGAWRELATHQAWDQRCRAALGLWRRRLAQLQKVERWAQERGQGQARDALHHWHTCWQRQQLLCEKYQRRVHGHLQGLWRAAFRGWQQEVARRRRIRSHFQAWWELVRHGAAWGPESSLPGCPEKSHLARGPRGDSQATGAVCGPALCPALEKPCAARPGRQTAEEGPGPAGL